MSGEAFRGLTNLRAVNLHENICISEAFQGSEKVKKLQRIVSEKCGIEREEASLTAAAAVTRLEASTVLFAVIFTMTVHF